MAISYNFHTAFHHSVNVFLWRPGLQNALKHTVGRALSGLVDEVALSVECSGIRISILKVQRSDITELVESG